MQNQTLECVPIHHDPSISLLDSVCISPTVVVYTTSDFSP